MRTTVKIFFIFIFLNSCNLFPQNVDELMQHANSLYQKGEYEKAIENYEQIVDQGYEGTALYYNLGNAYYRTGNIGYAILNYERAVKIDPGDEDILHNLNVANSKTADNIETMPEFFIFEWWESLLSLFTIKSWTYIAYFFYILVLISTAFYFFLKDPEKQKYSVFSGLASTIILIFVVVVLIVNLNREFNYDKAIIVDTEVNVKQSPDPQSSEAFVIHEGLKVTVEDQLDNWMKIKLRDGKVGWLTKEHLRII